MEFIGYFASVFVGFSLGLVGAGGSILTVPILVYFFAVEPTLATTYSLFIVGITSLIGWYSHFTQKNIQLNIAFFFGLPSLITVFLMRRYVMQHIPHYLFTINGFTVTKSILLMVVFSITMIVAAVSMINPQSRQNTLENKGYTYQTLIIQGALTGIITGFVGVGGGFLIIPSLIFFGGISMKQAVGTSLLIMSVSSLFGVIGDLMDNVTINYQFLAVFAAFASIGIITGSKFSRKINEEQLKPAFGWFVLVIGVIILIKEFI
ncbi:sulfite exporter TauE/SafE family protein [Rubrolithibacter danxiaensis]|uniref:sulfite exporter TauE/SafE family protein n=1 Tax=Rubrolithibacter danxiaensis TaxID=3390805 RepID=UPI003BF85558